MDKYYTVNIGSTVPVYFDSAYTGGLASAKFNGTIVIYAKNEGFEDAGNAAGETAHMINSDFGSGLMAVLMTRYARNANANPNDYVPDKNELITAVNEYAVKNGYGVMNIDYINVEITAETKTETTDDVEYVPSTTDGNERTDIPKPIETQPVTIQPTQNKSEISVAPILAITFGFLLIVAVVVIVILAKGNKSKATPAAPVVPEAPVEPEKKEEKPEEAKPEEKK
jgi:hypothetical protein